jgi:hypothetical protein
MKKLIEEIIFEIILYMDIKQLYNCLFINKFWNKIIELNSNIFFYNIFKQKMILKDNNTNITFDNNNNINWKYKTKLNFFILKKFENIQTIENIHKDECWYVKFYNF